MEQTDLAFENSDVHAEIRGHVDSIKNPKSGTIIADSIGKTILDNALIDSSAMILIRAKEPSEASSVSTRA
jgi:hypothetical protein